MNKKSELDCYLYFMWNVWSKDVCLEIFGDTIGPYIWAKWVYLCSEYGAAGAPAVIYAKLDEDKRRMLVDRAIAHYNK